MSTGAVRFSVVAFPKLEMADALFRLRERFAADALQPDPYIPIVPAWVPAELGEVVESVNSISATRGKLHPLAIACEGWHRRGDILAGWVTQGREELLELIKSVSGGRSLALIQDEPLTDVYLIVCRIADAEVWGAVLAEAERIGKTLGLVDSLVLLRTLPDGMWQRVATFPFGVGRVDFYERLFG